MSVSRRGRCCRYLAHALGEWSACRFWVVPHFVQKGCCLRACLLSLVQLAFLVSGLWFVRMSCGFLVWAAQ